MPRTVAMVAGLCISLLSCVCHAERASILIDANTGRVLKARNANLPSFPASLTKLMTIYLLLEAVTEKRLRFEQPLKVSARAQGQSPSRLGLKAGETITVRDAILALIVRSANDVAVVAAEALAGSEPAFADMMNAKARALGMQQTVFHNASGLPDPGQVSTARDLAILAQALQKHFPQHYHLFATESFEFRGVTHKSHNTFLANFEGATGMKTGFTCKSGFNLVSTVDRGIYRLIGVVLGEATPDKRNARMAELMIDGLNGDKDFDKLVTVEGLVYDKTQGALSPVNDGAIADTCLLAKHKQHPPAPAAVPAEPQIPVWSIQIGLNTTRAQAFLTAKHVIAHHRSLSQGRPLGLRQDGDAAAYRAAVTGLNQRDAVSACFTIVENGEYCRVLKPADPRVSPQYAAGD